jgi:hypothetical protein
VLSCKLAHQRKVLLHVSREDQVNHGLAQLHHLLSWQVGQEVAHGVAQQTKQG